MQIALAKRKINLITFFSVFLVMILLFSSVSLVAANTVLLFSDNIYDGITVGNIHVGGLSVEEAKKAITVAFKGQVSKSKITIKYQNETWSIAPQDIELEVNADDLAVQAYNIGRTGNIINILRERYLAINGGYSIPFIQNYNHEKLYAFLTTIAKTIDTPPQDASLKYDGKTIQIIPEVLGKQVDLAKSLADFTANLHRGISFNSQLTVNSLAPMITSQDFSEIDSLIAVYTTQFNPNNKNRYQNLDIATKKINNSLVKPGEIFSFNQIVGLRLPEYGYKEAPAFIDGKLVLDWGGGVCQVSTTLYNAALLADMGIEERTSHYQPPSYVPLGQDAAVADNVLDFRFKNTSSANIYITSQITNDQIIVSLFGKKKAITEEIHIESVSKELVYKTIVKQDATLLLGQKIVESEGQTGFEVTTYRVKMNNGKEVNRENLGLDEFKAEDRIIRVGTKSQPQRSYK